MISQLLFPQQLLNGAAMQHAMTLAPPPLS